MDVKYRLTTTTTASYGAKAVDSAELARGLGFKPSEDASVSGVPGRRSIRVRRGPSARRRDATTAQQANLEPEAPQHPSRQ